MTAAALLTAVQARAAVETVVVALGNNAGASGEEPLRFAEQDAERFAALFRELAGVRQERTFLIRGGRPAELMAALHEVKGRIAELRAGGSDTRLVFYYAGHGDRDALHMGDARLHLAELAGQLEAIPATLRLVFLDACRTAGASRRRGASPGEPFDIRITPPTPSGTVIVTSASPGEPAHESDELEGAVFTHYLLSGLRGAADSDRDGYVSFDEAYGFAFAHTLRRTVASAGSVQHPAFDVTIAGAGPLLLTRTLAASGRLVFPPGTDTRYFVYSMSGAGMLAEVPAGEREVVIAVPAGRFLVQRRQAAQSAVAQVDLPWGGTARVEAQSFVPVERHRVVRRGGGLVLHPFTLAVRCGGGLVFDGAAPKSGPPGLGLSLGYTHGQLQISLDALALTRPLQLQGLSGHEYRLSLRPIASYVVLGSWYTARFGAGAAVQPLWQALRRDEARRLRRAGFDPRVELWTTALGPTVAASFSVPLVRRLALEVGAAGSALWVKEAGGTTREEVALRLDADAWVGLGYAF